MGRKKREPGAPATKPEHQLSVPTYPELTIGQVRYIKVFVPGTTNLGKPNLVEIVLEGGSSRFPPDLTLEGLRAMLEGEEGCEVVRLEYFDKKNVMIAHREARLDLPDPPAPSPPRVGIEGSPDTSNEVTPIYQSKGSVTVDTVDPNSIAIPDDYPPQLKRLMIQHEIIRRGEEKRADTRAEQGFELQRIAVSALAGGVKEVLGNFGIWDERIRAMRNDLDLARIELARVRAANEDAMARLRMELTQQRHAYQLEIDTLRNKNIDMEDRMRGAKHALEDLQRQAPEEQKDMLSQVGAMLFERIGPRVFGMLENKFFKGGGDAGKAVAEAAKDAAEAAA